MGFVCLLSAVESEGKGGCLNSVQCWTAYTFTKQNRKPILAANKREGEMESREVTQMADFFPQHPEMLLNTYTSKLAAHFMCLLPIYLPSEPHPIPGLKATGTVGFLCLQTSLLSASRVCFNFLAHPKLLACCLTLHLVRIRNHSPMSLCRSGGNPDTERAS